MVHYLVDKRCILFLGQAASTTTVIAFAFYLPMEEWYYWNLGINGIDIYSGSFTGKDGEVYYSMGSTTVQLLGSTTTYRDFDWVSKEFTLDEPSQNKCWEMLKWDSSGTVVVKYGTENTDPTSGSGITATSGNWINIYKKTFQVYLDCTTSAYVDSVDLSVRRLIGKR